MAQVSATAEHSSTADPSALPPDVFVSYAREDGAAAYALSDWLGERSKRVWIDRKDVPDTADWRARAREGVEAAAAVLFVLSSDWTASESCRFELEHAVQLHKRLIPVAVPPEVRAEQLPPELRDLSWIPLERPDDEAALTRIATALETDLEWRDEHARLLVTAGRWATQAEDKSLLLRGRELREAEQWLAGPVPKGESVAPRHAAFILASRRAATRRQRTFLGLVLAALLIAVGLAAAALWQRNVAVDNEREANAQRRVAERNARESRSRELAAVGTTQLADDPELALLLGVEAAKSAPTVQAEELLRAALPRTNSAIVLPHPGLRAIAVDDAGTRAITGGSDGLARIWDLATGRRLAVLRGHSTQAQTDVTQGVMAVAMSGDGTVAASGGAEGDVRIWDVRTGRLLHRLTAPGGGASIFPISLAMAGGADSPLLVTAGENGIVRTWDPSTGRELAEARLDGFEVTSLAVSADGRRVAAVAVGEGGGDGLVAVFDAASLDRVSRVGTTAFDATFSPDGRRLGTSGFSSFGVWDVETGELERTFPGSQSGGGMAFAPDGRTVAIAPGTGEVRLMDVASGEQQAALRHPDLVPSVEFSSDGERLLTAGTDKTARLWDVGSRRLLQTLSAHRAPVSSASFLRDGSRLLTTGGDGTARVWRPSLADDPRELRGHGAVVDDLAPAADGRRMISASEDGTARIWDVATGKLIASVEHGSGRIDASVSVSPDGRLFATAGASPARVWRVRDGTPVATIPGDSHGAATFTLDGRYVVTGAGRAWDIRAGRVVKSLGAFETGPVAVRRGSAQAVFGMRSGGSAAVIAVPSGKRLVRLGHEQAGEFPQAAFSTSTGLLAVASGARVALWSVPAGKQVGVLPDQATLLSGAAFDAAGDRLLTASQRGVRIWDVARRRPVADLPHPRELGSAAFSRDGRLVVTASFDGFARIWEARTGRLIARLPGRSRQTWNEGFRPRAAFTPDGRTVLAATGGSELFVDTCPVCAPLPDLVEQAREATARRLTADERLTYLGS